MPATFQFSSSSSRARQGQVDAGHVTPFQQTFNTYILKRIFFDLETKNVFYLDSQHIFKKSNDVAGATT